jgi:hypothetical protein
LELQLLLEILILLKYKLPIILRNKRAHVEVVDGRTIESGIVTYESKLLDISLDNCLYKVAFNIIKTPNNPIILGQFFLEVYNPKIDWQKKELRFSKTCNIVEMPLKSELQDKGKLYFFEKNQWQCQNRRYSSNV